MRTACSSAILLAAVTAAALADKGGKKGDVQEARKEVDVGVLLWNVLKTEEAWSMKSLPLYESSASVGGRTRAAPSVTERQQKRLNDLLATRTKWANTLVEMAKVTPLYVRVTCRPADQPPVKEVEERFGAPDRKRGGWHYYGPVRLGVSDKGLIHTVQVDSPGWKRFCEEGEAMEAAAPTKAKAEADKDKEDRAASYVKFARKLAEKGEVEKAKARLREVVKDHAGTKAAAEAKTLLGELEKK